MTLFFKKWCWRFLLNVQYWLHFILQLGNKNYIKKKMNLLKVLRFVLNPVRFFYSNTWSDFWIWIWAAVDPEIRFLQTLIINLMRSRSLDLNHVHHLFKWHTTKTDHLLMSPAWRDSSWIYFFLFEVTWLTLSALCRRTDPDCSLQFKRRAQCHFYVWLRSDMCFV